MGVQLVIVQAPIEKLRQGCYFVDTPGIGSDIAANSATTERFLPEADAVIFVTSFDSPMQTEEAEFLGRVCEYAGKIFYVVNKSDLVEGEQRERLLDEIRDRIRAHGGNSEAARVFAVSARDALAAKMHGSSGDLTSTGLPDLESALWDSLTNGKNREFLTRVFDRTQKLLDAERFYIRIGQAQRVTAKRKVLVSVLKAGFKRFPTAARRYGKAPQRRSVPSCLQCWKRN